MLTSKSRTPAYAFCSASPQQTMKKARRRAGTQEIRISPRTQRLRNCVRTPWRVIDNHRQAWPESLPCQCW